MIRRTVSTHYMFVLGTFLYVYCVSVSGLQQHECSNFCIPHIPQESSWVRSCCHKGLLVNLIFLVVMIIGIIVGEVQYPLEGVRGGPITIANDSQCLGEKEGTCNTV